METAQGIVLGVVRVSVVFAAITIPFLAPFCREPARVGADLIRLNDLGLIR